MPPLAKVCLYPGKYDSEVPCVGTHPCSYVHNISEGSSYESVHRIFPNLALGFQNTFVFTVLSRFGKIVFVLSVGHHAVHVHVHVYVYSKKCYVSMVPLTCMHTCMYMYVCMYVVCSRSWVRFLPEAASFFSLGEKKLSLGVVALHLSQ